MYVPRLARRSGALRLPVRQNPLRRTQYSHAYTRSNASAAAKIFSDYANTGKSLSAIARELTAAGCASAVRPAGWDSKSVSRILRSPVYARADRAVLSYYVTAGIGTVVNSEEEFDGTFSALLTGRRSAKSGAVNPPERQTLSLTNFSGIVDSATWLRCQQKLSGTLPVGTSRPGSASFLSGLLKCGTCGYAVSVKRAGSRRYLCCRGRYNLHICSVRSISARPEETEYIVINEISSLIRNALRTLSGGRRRLDEIETEIENLMRRCSLAAERSMKYINRRISQLEQEKKNPPAAAIFYPRLPCGCAVSANSQKTKKRGRRPL